MEGKDDRAICTDNELGESRGSEIESQNVRSNNNAPKQSSNPSDGDQSSDLARDNDIKNLLASTDTIDVPVFAEFKKNSRTQYSNSSKGGVERNEQPSIEYANSESSSSSLTYSQVARSQEHKKIVDSNKALLSKIEKSKLQFDKSEATSTLYASSNDNYENKGESSATRASAMSTRHGNTRKNDEDFISVIFHVHVDCDGLGSPFVFGNVKELGNWNSPIVRLRKSNRKTPHGVRNTYWFSEPVKISLANLENASEVRYKYGIVVSQQTASRKSEKVIFEGFETQYERTLLLQCGNQYDIWENNELLAAEIKDFAFLNIIYDSLNSSNLKEKIIELQSILEYHQSHLEILSLHKFIRERLLEAKVKEQKFFLLILLGYHDYFSYDQHEFPESMVLTLLNTIKHVREYTYPSDAYTRLAVTRAVGLLVHRNAVNGSFEWLNIFSVNQYVDPEFRFIESLNRLKYDTEKKFNTFLDVFKEKAFPYIERVDYKYIEILRSSELYWSYEDYLSSLTSLSLFMDIDMLAYFIQHLKNCLENFGEVSEVRERYPQICKNWYQRLLNRLHSASTSSIEIDDKFVIWIFTYAARLYPIIKDNRKLWKSIMTHSICEVKKCLSSSVYNATVDVIKLEDAVVNGFIGHVENLLGDSSQVVDERLLTSVEQICRSIGEILGLVCHVMTCLENNIDSLWVKNALDLSALDSMVIPTEFHLSILAGAKFWNAILRATGCAENLKKHNYFMQVKNAIAQVRYMLVKGSINIRLLQELLKYDDEFLLYYFDSINGHSAMVVNEDILLSIREKCRGYMQTMDHLNSFYVRYCPQNRVLNIQDYIQDLNEQKFLWDHITLNDIQSPNYFFYHEDSIEISTRLYKYNKSQTFYNVFENVVQTSVNESNVESFARITLPSILDDYENRCKEHEDWENMKLSSAAMFWSNVTDINAELDFTDEFVQIDRDQRFLTMLARLSRADRLTQRLKQLSVVIEMFNTPRVQGDWLEVALVGLLAPEITLRELSLILDSLGDSLGEVNEDSWNLIKELSMAVDFIAFLREIADHDLKNLINGVDDEKLIQEDTVSSLIQVKQFLVPLLNVSPKLNLDTFLEELRKVANHNPMLANKIALCNSNNTALQNMYANISNRGEVTKEKIQNAVKIGTYRFEWTPSDLKCKVALSYTIGKATTVSYDIGDLQDLKGRALLISGNVNVGSKKSKDLTDEFVRHVDIAQMIVNVSERLIETGNFGYRRYQVSVKGTNRMTQLLEKLQDELKKWQVHIVVLFFLMKKEALVNKAQQSHFYLTFFPARHILEFYDFFIGKSTRNANICQTLIKFVNPNAKLPQKPTNSKVVERKDVYLQTFNEIGEKLHAIFAKVSKRKRPLKVPVDRVISDVVERGKLFVASCNDKSRLPNVIMSLYANHGSYPEAWQLLICTTSTTLEELSIFLKRCFFAPKNGYDNHLFCLANLELLDYELQYNLVNKIRAMREKEKDYYLALICCPEAGMHHHILDQFSDYRSTKGLNTASMKRIYQELCPRVFCVSSELSGQGKTEWIKRESFENKLCPKHFLISDDADYVKLVRQLKEVVLRPFDCMHINIVSSDYPGEVNMWLFQVLTLRVVSSNADIACFPNTHVYIEIASSFEQHLLRSLPMIEYLQRTHLTWNIKDLLVTQEINSPIQVACLYLRSLESGTIDNEDILFKGQGAVTSVLPHEECQAYLEKYFLEGNNDFEDISSFRFLEIFVNVFAYQLVRLSSSSYFRVDNLKLMLGEGTNIRSTLVNTLLEISKDFATRSIRTKSAQLEATSTDAIGNAALGTIVNWDDSNHLLVFFLSQTPDSICALYRVQEKVPEVVKELMKSQYISEVGQEWKLEDYHKMSMKELLQRLEGIARKTFHEIDYPPYALSVDNLLKMALILLRARSNIPVVICGEAGCGKTSLIGFLARTVEVQLFALNLHAGIKEDDISQFMAEVQQNARRGETWVFFDEINTCNNIGLLADLIAHRVYRGRPIRNNIRIFAACNPYRLRTRSISEAGLEARKFEEQSNLVYEVRPLPDQILDYVWDYGVLQRDDEMRYIQIMVKVQLKELDDPVLSKLLFASQQFIRQVEEPYSVSLRDIKRAIKLIKFFYESLQDRPPIRGSSQKYPPTSIDSPSIQIRSFVLALGLCYQSRLYEKPLRRKYREKMCEIFKNAKFNLTEEIFNNIIREEQEDYVNRMVCPPNTAQNDALLENVLVMVVCILTRIPVFIVGAPGSSKSLAVRLVSQNLRGSDSNDEYFRKLPQGSSSSTSDGILKVFQKAQNFQETSSKEFPVISVVLLDEVGLAETSPFNPLKVLHSLLEPSYPSDGPKVSVIGISNWRLDNSKSSRALLVQRPKFDSDDLVDTAVRLLGNKTQDRRIQRDTLFPLAIAYSEYEQKGQTHLNFHGLRDYYALVKSLSTNELTSAHIQMCLARNFGGTDQFADICQRYFGNVINTFDNNQVWVYRPIPIDKLIHTNLEDEGARHLMVIGKSDSIVNLLTYELRQRNLNPVIILGSQFSDDQDDYSYNVLSRIMMCVEAGRPLILTDLEIIYGSLYDLWNQNYIVVGNSEDPKYYTRVALGAYANPMLYVNKNFRCILVLDEKNLSKADPPLLNRFEKQKMTINDILTDNEKDLVYQLSIWTKRISTIEMLNPVSVSHDKFTQKDLFIGFDQEETLQSLVIDIKKKNPDAQDSEILTKCKESLVNIASSDGIVRAERSALSLDEVRHWKNVYFKAQHHDHLAGYFENLLHNENSESCPDGHQVIINTFSNINTDVKLCLQGLITCQILKLSTFKTEAQFQNQVKNFWFESSNEMLILQCDITTINAGCIKLAKFIIEQSRNEYLLKKSNAARKHACIILHIHRDHKASLNAFNFMCGWRQVTIETLTPQEKCLSALLDGDLCDIISKTYSFEEILQQELLWCLLCMKYPASVKSIDHIKTLNAKIPQNKNLVDYLKIKTQDWLQIYYSSRDWQYYVASNKKLLYPYSSFSAALQAYIRSIVRQPVARVLCALERLFATKTFLSLDQAAPHQQELMEIWREMFNDKTIINIDELSDPKPDGYVMPAVIYDFQFPFSWYFMKRIEGFKKTHEEELELLKEDLNNIDPSTGDLYESVVTNHTVILSNTITSSIKNIKTSLEYFPELYFNDFVSRICADESKAKYAPLMSFIFRWRLGSEKVRNPVLLHAHWWRYSKSIMTQFQLAQMCPPVVNDASLKNANLLNISFEDHLVEEVTKLMHKKLNDIKSVNQTHIPQLLNWQHEISLISTLCDKLSEVSNFSSLHLMQVCSSFTLADSTTLSNIKEIMKIGNSSPKKSNAFSSKFINSVFGIFEKFQNCSEYLVPKLLFTTKCLNFIALESPERLELYKNIFSQNLLPIADTSVVYLIFKQEEETNPGTFVKIINTPKKALLQSSRLRMINECLSNQVFDSSTSTLCCDVLQKSLFSKYSLRELADLYRYSVEALDNTESVILRKISAIACLKEFAHKFWDHSIREPVLQPIEFDQARTGDLDTVELIAEVNNSMSSTLPLIHSFKIYFLRALRYRGLSMNEVRRFCEMQRQILPWLWDLPWNKICESRLSFNPYWKLEDYVEIEKSFTTLYGMENKGSFNSFFASLKKKEMTLASLTSISLMGLVFNRLHIIRSSRDWEEAENRSAVFLLQKIDQSTLSPIYKQYITKLINNEHELLHVDPTTTSSELLLKSVICHLIALHASIPANSSPLAYMLQNLDKCSKFFIPTCPSDVESVVINAVIQSAWGKSPVAANFLQNDETDALEYCMGHIQSDWFVLKKIFNLSDEDLALLLHSILNSMAESTPRGLMMHNKTEREEWEKYFLMKYVKPATKNSAATARNFLMEISEIATSSQESVDIMEGEINQLLEMDKRYNEQHLPKLWRIIDEFSFDSFRAFYSGDLANNVENYPFLSVFFKYEQQLPHIRHLMSIIRFLRMLSSKLEYRLSRSQAQQFTFQEFIADKSNDDESTEANNILKSAFEDFAQAWNSVIGLVQNYQCHELPLKPLISIESPVAFGLVEPRDTGVYICAILEYLIGLQNNFLQEVALITPRKCASLVFLEDISFRGKEANSASSKNMETTQYCIHSMRINQIQSNNIINFEWNDEILQCGQRNLEAGRGQDVTFNLQKIESQLARSLVFEKVHIDTVNDSQLYMEPFAYHMELFQGCIRILGDIKGLIPQQTIPTEKVEMILGTAMSSTISSSGYQHLTFDNASELLSSLEILLCFVKKTSIGDGEILVNEYVNQWMKLSNLIDNESFCNLLNVGLKLKQLVALYELVEEQVANGVIKYINDKYKEPLTPELEHEINMALDFQPIYQEEDDDTLLPIANDEPKKIPAEYFSSALKRFMFRFLNENSSKEKDPLSIYFTDMTLNLWSSGVKEEMVDNFFPDSLLVAHVYETYVFINDRLEVTKKQTPLITKPKATTAQKVAKIVTVGKKQLNNKGKPVSPSPTTKRPSSSSKYTASTGTKNTPTFTTRGNSSSKNAHSSSEAGSSSSSSQTQKRKTDGK
ncbi:11533_t:CDS:10 [Acaulospora colombiana]|uniref:11533_t:CDS:1 n=1 Tax=Acaulospora colombiana TaxID=27376 RepID=A0ACA9JWC0_9GLOM|nr:11533_t:CDS:10 [Acaulospora colombiana]